MAHRPSTEAPSDRPPSLLYLIKQLELAVRAQLDEVLRPAAMTTVQYTALSVLDRRDMTTAELARNSFVTDQTMAGLVAALEARGLVERHTHPADRRSRVIRLTPQGRELLAGLAGPVASIERRLLAGFSPAEVVQLRRHLVTGHAELTEQGLPASG